MQWEKLERSYQALETLLAHAAAADKFNLILFNSRRNHFSPRRLPRTAPAFSAHWILCVPAGLRGGTDLQKALQEGLRRCSRRRRTAAVILCC